MQHYFYAFLTLMFLVSSVFTKPAIGQQFEVFKLGLTDVEHQYINGGSTSWAIELAENQVVGGYSRRYQQQTVDLGTSAWIFKERKIQKVGLWDEQHTRSDGYRESSFGDFFFLGNSVNSAGQAVGISKGFTQSNVAFDSAWFFDGSQSLDISLAGPEYSNAAGFRQSSVRGMTSQGMVFGSSSRFRGDSSFAFDTTEWAYANGQHTLLGLKDGEHTRSDGFRSSANAGTLVFNDNGQATGVSARFSGTAINGASAWFFDGQESIRIGLTDSDHTSRNGLQYTNYYGPGLLSETGLVAGVSTRYTNDSESEFGNGQSAWLFDGQSSTRVGLVGGGFVNERGESRSGVSGINASGQVAGWSTRYEDGRNNAVGSTSWLAHDGTTEAIGLFDQQHSRYQGGLLRERSSTIVAINSDGTVVGHAKRFSIDRSNGESVWMHKNNESSQVGLYDEEHTRASDDYKQSYSYQLTESNLVYGTSKRYHEGAEAGYSSWVSDGNETIRLGFSSDEFVNEDGYAKSELVGVSDDGFATGYSLKYVDDETFVAGWVHRFETDETVELAISTRPDGTYNSSPMFIGNDGLVLGTYTIFDTLGEPLFDRIFYYHPDHGLNDLAFFSDPQQLDWAYFGEAFANSDGSIAGWGQLRNSSEGFRGFLMNPVNAVPEPGSGSCLIFFASASIAFQRRRHRMVMAGEQPSKEKAKVPRKPGLPAMLLLR